MKQLVRIVSFLRGDAVRGFLRYALVAIVSCISIAWLDPYRDEVSRGNEEFHDKKYNAAKTHYTRADQYAPGEEDKKKLSYNKGDADYMMESHSESVAEFEQSLRSEDKEVQKKAFFNMGNAYVKMGKYKEAVQSYINALKIDPGYQRAKRNIEYLLAKRQNDEQKQQNDKSGGGGNKDKDKNKDKNKNKNSQNKQENKQAGAQGNNLNKAQIKNLLDTMKQNPVRRYKGSPNDTRSLEKPW